jgi:hypothetical protein
MYFTFFMCVQFCTMIVSVESVEFIIVSFLYTFVVLTCLKMA